VLRAELRDLVDDVALILSDKADTIFAKDFTILREGAQCGGE
jgi:hypothetical protein